ncbi:TonB-dependent receptor [soil metagenome]
MQNIGSIFIALSFLLLFQGISYAHQSGTIEGVIYDSGSNEPLFGANVFVIGTNRGASANADGEFTIRNVSPGTVTLRVSYLGYRTQEEVVVVEAGETLEVVLNLTWAGIEGQEVTVSAQARGQMSAINQQRSSNTISNIVSSDRIQELPDVNAAESIGRLPGISVQRSGGEANKIVVRGLSPKYNTVTVNGVRMPSTDTQNRSVDLSLVSSNMLDGIEVTKALTADQDADAIGGTVDLRLMNAREGGISLDFKAQGGYTALQDTYGNYQVTGSVGDRFLDNKLGVILNFNADRYDRSADFLNAGYESRLGDDDERFPIPTSLNLQENILDRSRMGGSAILDYRISNGGVVFNAMYNRLENDGQSRRDNMNYGNRIHEYVLTQGFNETSVFASGLILEQDLGWVQYDAGVSLTGSVSESPNDFNWQFREESAANATQREDTLRPRDIPLLFRNDIDNTYLFDLTETWRKTNENEVGTQVNFRFPFSVSNNINGYFKTGAKYRRLDRENNQVQQGANAFYGGGQSLRVAIAENMSDLDLNGTNRLPLTPFQADYTRDNFLEGRFSLGYTINPDRMHQINQIAKDGEFTSFSRQGSLGNDYVGNEQFTSFFMMSEVEIGRYLTIMPGLRYEHESTDYSAKYSGGLEPPAGTALEDVSFLDTTATRNNDFLLPNIHMQIKPTDWINLRLAYTHTISRPDFRQFAPITYYNFTGGWANAPNPDLKSSRSRNYDASLSVFQSKLGFFTASAFYKEIEDLIWGVSFNTIPGQQILPDLEIREAAGNVVDVFSSINNPNPAYVKGIELDWQTSFWYLPSFLKGLVLNINYTHIVTETEVPAFELVEIPISPRPPRPPFNERVLEDRLVSRTLPDQPSDIINVTVGYDFRGFSSRVSFFQQMESIIGTGDAFSTWNNTYNDDYFRIDVSLKQQLPANFEVFLNLNNVNSQGDRTYQSPVYQYPLNEQNYGFTTDLGVRFKL